MIPTAARADNEATLTVVKLLRPTRQPMGEFTGCFVIGRELEGDARCRNAAPRLFRLG